MSTHPPAADAQQAAATQSTLSSLERARDRALDILHTSHTQEATARARFNTARERTARAIYAARLDGMTWQEIGQHLGGMADTSAIERLAVHGIDRPASIKKDEDTWPRHSRALHNAHSAEQAASTAAETATRSTATAIALARTIGHTWAAITQSTGINRTSQLGRLQRAFGTHNRAVPSVAKAADYRPDEHAQAAHTLTGDVRGLWKSPKVYKACAEGVSIAVRTTLAAHLNAHTAPSPADMAGVLAAVESAHRRAVDAAVVALNALHLDGLMEVEAVDAARQCVFQAAAQSGTT